ncbi:MAG: hybrid sensor histidine kinase/response regulator, partial [Tannerellaceae bacterium]|nr:hybrid sensor histidine kinase/response regulator [Tannerellaceae bacterium]
GGQFNYGLDLFDKKTKRIRTYKEFSNKSYFAVSDEKDIYIINEDNRISYFDYDTYVFHKAQLDDISFENILDIVIDRHNILWVFTRDKNCVTYQIERNGKYMQFIRNHLYHHPEGFLYTFHENRDVYFVDHKFDFFRFETGQMKTTYIRNLSLQIQQKGEISSIISHHSDYYIGFKSSGLIWLKENKSRKSSYEISEIDIRSGIFCLVKDRNQDVIWVGTDGQGVFMYYIDSFSLRSHALSNLPYPVNNPVRALFLDSHNDLWIGTKGDGIVKIRNYEPDVTIENKDVVHLHTGNSRLFDNSVYAFTESKQPLLWVGTEEGINYYSYSTGELKELLSPDENRPVRYVHSICEVNDTTLWVATVGEGIVKVVLSGSQASPGIKETKHFTIDGGAKSSNYFFSSFVENDSIIWFGNRGFGAFRFNTQTEDYTVYTFDDNDNQTVNDVFSIMKNENGYWFGTSFGLVCLHEGQKSIFNEAQGFPDNTVHSILAEDEENIWLSTNQGIIRFNTAQQTFQTFKEHHDRAVTEFSDGAFYKDEQTGLILFGGINGFLTIQGNDYSQAIYMPDIHFTNLSIFGREYNIHDFLNKKKRGEKLELNYSQNFFSVSFTAIDYINGNDYSWFYKLDELSGNWIENGKSGSAAFTNISPGNYTLSVMYRNNITGKQSEAQLLMITILPPLVSDPDGLFYLLWFVCVIIDRCCPPDPPVVRNEKEYHD